MGSFRSPEAGVIFWSSIRLSRSLGGERVADSERLGGEIPGAHMASFWPIWLPFVSQKLTNLGSIWVRLVKNVFSGQKVFVVHFFD